MAHYTTGLWSIRFGRTLPLIDGFGAQKHLTNVLSIGTSTSLIRCSMTNAHENKTPSVLQLTERDRSLNLFVIEFIIAHFFLRHFFPSPCSMYKVLDNSKILLNYSLSLLCTVSYLFGGVMMCFEWQWFIVNTVHSIDLFVFILISMYIWEWNRASF